MYICLRVHMFTCTYVHTGTEWKKQEKTGTARNGPGYSNSPRDIPGYSGIFQDIQADGYSRNFNSKSSVQQALSRNGNKKGAAYTTPLAKFQELKRSARILWVENTVGVRKPLRHHLDLLFGPGAELGRLWGQATRSPLVMRRILSQPRLVTKIYSNLVVKDADGAESLVGTNLELLTTQTQTQTLRRNGRPSHQRPHTPPPLVKWVFWVFMTDFVHDVFSGISPPST